MKKVIVNATQLFPWNISHCSVEPDGILLKLRLIGPRGGRKAAAYLNKNQATELSNALLYMLKVDSK